MLIKTFSAAVRGIHADIVTCEINASSGIRVLMVGLPDISVKESRDRIQAAVTQIGLKFPRRQLIINLAPADLKKEGSHYDLPLAVGILAAGESINPEKLDKHLMVGELSLDGHVNPVKGTLPIALQAREAGFDSIIVPSENAPEAAVVEGLNVYPVDHLKQVVDYFNDKITLTPFRVDIRKHFEDVRHDYDLDFEDVKGQDEVKRAFEVAAAGGHNLLMIGPPGSGKSMLAKRLPSILPPMTLNESLETTAIHSVAGNRSETGLIVRRPFRSPHHSISAVALIGGGSNPAPGEVSLAHNGVLFLDELPEFNRSVLEVMRQPLEDREICIARARSTVVYPAGMMLVASMNPCPCGYFNHPSHPCICNPGLVKKYMNKISGPLLDRIDIQIEIVPVPFEDISSSRKSEKSADVLHRVVRARKIQQERFRDVPGIYCNAQMTSRLLRRFAAPDNEGLQRLKHAMNAFSLSARAYDRILKVARTIADLDDSPLIRVEHIGEAICYRNLDRENWAG